MCVKKVVIWGLFNSIVVKFILGATLDSSQVVYGLSNKIFKDVMSLLRTESWIRKSNYYQNQLSSLYYIYFVIQSQTRQRSE